MANLKCSKCGSEKVIPDVDMFDLGHGHDYELKARVGYAHPDAVLFKVPIHAEMKANICGECGYTEFMAKNPAKLYQEYLEGKARSEK